MQLSNLQQEILESPDRKTVVLASAASGKTRLMTEKVRQLLRAGVDPQGIAVITFTNMAATELRQRLGEDYKDGLFVGTVHSLANYFLKTAGIKTDKVLDDEKFDDLFLMVKKNPACVKHLEWILLDEAQDSNDLQFEFLFDVIKPDCFFVCGDTRQCIYRFNGSNPDLLRDLSQDPEVYTCDLNENYRNGSEILKFARKLSYATGVIDNSIAMRKAKGTVNEMKFNPIFIVNSIRACPPYSQWAILCRTWKQIEEMQLLLKENKIPYDTFKQGDLKREELLEKLEDDTVKILTIHSAKGLEWNNVIVRGAYCRGDDEKCIRYVAATRARDLLIWIK